MGSLSVKTQKIVTFKYALLSSILLHSICLLSKYQFFYANSWIEPFPESLKIIQPWALIFINIHNPDFALFWAIAEILVLLLALFNIGNPLFMLPVVFMYNNSYHKLWAVQDGGNNLIQIMLWFLLLFWKPHNPCSALARFYFRLRMSNYLLFLIQCQLALVYWCAFVSKLQGPLWQNGMALYYIFQSDYFGAPWARDLVMNYPWLGTLGTYSAILFQVVFVFLIWNRAFRPYLVIAGTVFHILIGVTMNLYTFAVTMTTFYFCFLEKKEFKTLNEIHVKVLSFFSSFIEKKCLLTKFFKSNGCFWQSVWSIFLMFTASLMTPFVILYLSIRTVIDSLVPQLRSVYGKFCI